MRDMLVAVQNERHSSGGAPLHELIGIYEFCRPLIAPEELRKKNARKAQWALIRIRTDGDEPTRF
jgi:hypothetical protein